MTGEQMNSQKRNEDDFEFARAVEVLTRLRCRQGQSAFEVALKEAAGFEWRFCGRCGSETAWDGELCVGCGGKAHGGAAPRD